MSDVAIGQQPAGIDPIDGVRQEADAVVLPKLTVVQPVSNGTEGGNVTGDEVGLNNTTIVANQSEKGDEVRDEASEKNVSDSITTPQPTDATNHTSNPSEDQKILAEANGLASPESEKQSTDSSSIPPEEPFKQPISDEELVKLLSVKGQLPESAVFEEVVVEGWEGGRELAPDEELQWVVIDEVIHDQQPVTSATTSNNNTGDQETLLNAVEEVFNLEDTRYTFPFSFLFLFFFISCYIHEKAQRTRLC